MDLVVGGSCGHRTGVQWGRVGIDVLLNRPHGIDGHENWAQ